jgi:hypothetical protein
LKEKKMRLADFVRPAGAAWISAVICLALFAGACSEDDSVVSPPATVTVSVDVTPDSTIFEWDLTGPGDFLLSGSGDTVLAHMEAGEYQIKWRAVRNYITPWPTSQSLAVAPGASIEFACRYELRPTDRLDVLFLGSSYFGSNMMVGLFRSLAGAKGIDVLTDARNPSGMYLEYHANNATSIASINSRDWDCVILQGVGSIVAYPERAHFDLMATLRSLESTIHSNCSTTKIIFCMPWAFEDGMLWTPGGTDDYFAMQQRIYDNTVTYPDSVDISIAPVGWAWNSILLENPGEHYLHMYDWNHPSPRGSYLMACVIFVSVYREPVSDAPYRAGLPEDEAAHFQEVATEVVLENLALWNLGGRD